MVVSVNLCLHGLLDLALHEFAIHLRLRTCMPYQSNCSMRLDDLGKLLSTSLCHSSHLCMCNSVVANKCIVVFALQSPWLFGSVCKQSDTVGIPQIQPVWTCGIEVTGNFNCPAGE